MKVIGYKNSKYYASNLVHDVLNSFFSLKHMIRGVHESRTASVRFIAIQIRNYVMCRDVYL